MRRALIACALLAVCLPRAEARPARCETTDDGAYPCDFRTTDRRGSFRIAARGKPTFAVVVDERGQAQAFADFGGRGVALPGTYRPRRDRSGCWVSDATGAEICAR